MKKLLKYLPIWISKRFVYQYFKLNTEKVDEVIFKVAETKDELLQALTLLQDVFKDEKLSSANEAIRTTIYHAAPMSTVIVTKRGEK